MVISKKSLPSIGIVIPTYQAEKHLNHCLPPLMSSLKNLQNSQIVIHPRLLIVDSSSTDRTVEIAKQFDAEVLVIPKTEFNHGGTRERGRKYLQSDIVVMMTQDAYPNEQTIFQLIQPLISGAAAVAYARQIPHIGAGYFEAFHRYFNYPVRSEVRSIKDSNRYGVQTFFCSNSCAAYLNSVLDDIGGFPHVAFGEDTIAVARLLHKGHAIAYVAESIVRHSHSYTLMEEYQRNYIIGKTRAEQRHWLECGSSDEKRGRQYAIRLMRDLLFKKPYLVPYAFIYLIIKWIGYQQGKKLGFKTRVR